MAPLPGLTIAVLAGGKSRRFRTQKLTHRWGERTVLDRTLEALAPLEGRIFLLVASRAGGRILVRNLSQAVELWPDPDLPAPSGPGAAVAAALPEVPGEWLLVVPGDQPFLETTALRRWLRVAPGLSAGLSSLWEPRLLLEPAFQLHHLPEMRPVGRRLTEGCLPPLRLSSLLRASPRCALVDLRALSRHPASFRSLNRPRDQESPAGESPCRSPEPPHYMDPTCASLVWGGLGHYRSHQRGPAYRSFFQEAVNHAASGRWLLSLHALEDAHRFGTPPPRGAP